MTVKKLFKIAQKRITKNAINKMVTKSSVNKSMINTKKILVNTTTIVFDTKKIEENKDPVKN
tara:strand:+ start:2325 stop:2510 length:186 start_codon:yes stop_codon:yes gene_type:complete